MKKYLLTCLILVGCASKTTTTSDAKSDLDAQWTKKIGSATKNDFVADFGRAEWCKMELGGGETCRFYMKKGIRWAGEGNEKKAITQYDEVVANFDSNGVLREFKSAAQR